MAKSWRVAKQNINRSIPGFPQVALGLFTFRKILHYYSNGKTKILLGFFWATITGTNGGLSSKQSGLMQLAESAGCSLLCAISA